ncbi:MAG: hypothetical protein O2779_05145 [Nanoarchaeota archaeon]|nr:hypothetical protein [Nanoarchaeota archaeon]
MVELHKKGIAFRYLVMLILGLIALVFLLWYVFNAQQNSYDLLDIIKSVL